MVEHPGQPHVTFADWCPQWSPLDVEHHANLLRAERLRASELQRRRALSVATRYAAIESGAMSGLYSTDHRFTRTFAEQTARWQVALRRRGSAIARSIDICLNGYDLVQAQADGRRPVTSAWIRRLHEVLTARAHGAHVAGRDAQLTTLAAELNSPAFAVAHPVLQAAYALFSVHALRPFRGGNARVARALSSVFLYRNPGVPLVVLADQLVRYDQAVSSERQIRLVQFVGDRVIAATDLVRHQLSLPLPEPQRGNVVQLADWADDGPSARFRAHHLLIEAVEAGLTASMSALGWPRSLIYSVRRESAVEPEQDGSVRPGFYTPGDTALRVTVRHQSLGIEAELHIVAWMNSDASAAMVCLVTGQLNSVTLQMMHNDLLPSLSSGARLKIQVWCRYQLDLLLQDLRWKLDEPH